MRINPKRLRDVLAAIVFVVLIIGADGLREAYGYNNNPIMTIGVLLISLGIGIWFAGLAFDKGDNNDGS